MLKGGYGINMQVNIKFIVKDVGRGADENVYALLYVNTLSNIGTCSDQHPTNVNANVVTSL